MSAEELFALIAQQWADAYALFRKQSNPKLADTFRSHANAIKVTLMELSGQSGITHRQETVEGIAIFSPDHGGSLRWEMINAA